MGIESEIGRLGSATGIISVDVSSVDQTLTKLCRALMVTVSGDVNVTFADGSSGVLPALNPGTMYPVAIKAVLHASTTATGIKALV